MGADSVKSASQGQDNETDPKNSRQKKRRGFFFRKRQKNGAASGQNKLAHLPEEAAAQGEYRTLFLYSLFMNIVFILMIIAMFILTLTSDSPNIINYRTKIEDEYASWSQDLEQWAQELTEKEKELNEREQNLNDEMYMDVEYE